MHGRPQPWERISSMGKHFWKKGKLVVHKLTFQMINGASHLKLYKNKVALNDFGGLCFATRFTVRMADPGDNFFAENMNDVIVVKLYHSPLISEVDL